MTETHDWTRGPHPLHLLPAALTAQARNDEIQQLRDRLTKAENRLTRVDALHQPAPERLHGNVCCQECGADWPCPTNRTKETT